MHANILDKRWEIRFVRLRGECNGICHPPEKKRKAIRINKTLQGEKRLDALLHEMLHAANWHLDEEFVTQCATDMAGVLWKLGYRCESE